MRATAGTRLHVLLPDSSCRLTVQHLVLGWTRSTTARAEDTVLRREISVRVSTADLCSQKNNNPDQIIRRHWGDMSWCTAPTSQAALVAARGRCAPAMTAMHRAAPSSKALSSKKSFTENLCLFVVRRREVQPSLPDGTSVGPCDLCRDPWADEALTSEHCKGRDDNAVQQR